MNSFPLSMYTDLGMPPPPLIQVLIIADVTSLALLPLSGAIMMYLEKPSMHVRTYLHSLIYGGKGPIKSMYSTSFCWWLTLGTCTPSLRLGTCFSTQTEQCSMYLCTSAFIFPQIKYLVIPA